MFGSFTRALRCGVAILTGLVFFAPGQVKAATYDFVGSWTVDQLSRSATGNAPFTGQEAAAFLFGGSANDYYISTAGIDETAINFSNWVTVWGAGSDVAVGGDPTCAGYPCGRIVAQDFKVDTGRLGIYDIYGDTSALGRDWAVGSQFTNYAFVLSTVALPGALPLFASVLAMLGLGGWWRKRRQAAGAAA